MKTTLKVVLLPTKEQESKMFEFCHTARFTYNCCLAYKEEMYSKYKKSLKTQDLIEYIQSLKYSTHSWLKNTSESVTKQAIKDLEVAYKRFFGGDANYPKFKKRNSSTLSFYQRTDKLRYWGDSVTITGIGRVKVKGVVNFPKKPLNPRVKYDGKFWYLTVAYEMESDLDKKNLTDISLGVDLGIKKLAVLSDGREIININKTSKVKKLEKRLKRLQRKVSNKYENNREGVRYSKTKNIIKVEKQIRLIQRTLTNIRENHIHTATANIVKTKPCRVVVEDLNVKGMMKNRYLSKSIQKQCFNKFIKILQYKCERRGIAFVKANRFYPSSKLCSCCGNKKVQLSLSERVYSCDNCGLEMDRDLNASINLSKYVLNSI